MPKLSYLVVAFALTILGVKLYSYIALNFNIIAIKNYRTLHEGEVPKGSGIILAAIFVLVLYVYWLNETVFSDLVFVLCAGGLVATVFGFLDDIINIPAIIKLFIQLLLSTFIVYSFGEASLLLEYQQSPVQTGLFGAFVAIIVLAWLINSYNFMDGADGMAASGAVFICSTISAILILIQGEIDLGLIFAIFAIIFTAFLFYNWPPANIFMGDAGSVFIGYTFGAFIIYTMAHSYITIWTWLIVFGYFWVDTTITLILRIIIVKRWYSAHRSHAYQNLARIWKDHSKILNIVNYYHLFWILPLAFLSVIYTQFQEFFCLLAVIPSVIWTLKYGPLLSSD